MRILILDSRKTIHEGDAKRVVLPCEDGEMGVLDFHQPFVCSLTAGSLRVDKVWEGGTTVINIKRGMAKMKGNEIVIMIE